MLRMTSRLCGGSVGGCAAYPSRRTSGVNVMNKNYRIAVIPGDGIGKEVVPEGIRVLEAAGQKFRFEVKQDWMDFASCDYYLQHGRMMPEDWKERIGQHDAIFFGAVGWPEKVPDHISLWGSLILWRREFDQYVNLRPVRLMPRPTSSTGSTASVPPRASGSCRCRGTWSASPAAGRTGWSPPGRSPTTRT